MIISGYQLDRLSGPELDPLSLAEAKRACRIDEDQTVEDQDVLDMITSARELVEEFTHRTMCTTLWRLTLDRFPYSCDALALPMGPLQELQAIGYLDAAGAAQTIDLSTLEVSRTSRPPWIRPFRSFWPGISGRACAITVDYWAGFAGQGSPEDASGVPKRVKQAMRMLVAHWYANRESVVAETRIVPSDMLYSFERSLDDLKDYP